MAEDEENKPPEEGAEQSEEPGEAGTDEEASSQESAVDNSAEAVARRKSIRLFILLLLVNLIPLVYLYNSLTFEAEEEAPTKSYTEEATGNQMSEEVREGEEPGDPKAYKRLAAPYPFEAFLVNVVARDRQGRPRLGQKVLRLRFEVLPTAESAVKAMEVGMPKLRDEINLLLSRQSYANLSASEGREALRRLIQGKINEVIQPESISKIYFTEFVIN